MDVASRLVNLAELGTNLCRSKVPDSDLRFFLFPRYELQQRNGFLKTQGPSTLNKNKDYKGNEPIASQTLGLRFPRVLLDAPSAFSNNNNHITLRKTKKKKKEKTNTRQYGNRRDLCGTLNATLDFPPQQEPARQNEMVEMAIYTEARNMEYCRVTGSEAITIIVRRHRVPGRIAQTVPGGACCPQVLFVSRKNVFQ